MRSDAKVKPAPKGRPKIRIEDIMYGIDALNLQELGTQYSKVVRIKESTFFLLHHLKDNDESFKTIDDVIVSLLQVAALVKYTKGDN